MVNRIIKLIKQKGMSVNAVEKQLGFGNGAIKRFSTSSPSVDKIVALSNFLNSSVEYIITGKEAVPSLSEDELELLTYYKELPEKEQIKLIERAATLSEVYRAQLSEPKVPVISLYCSDNRVSAGFGDELYDYEQWDTIDVIETQQSRKADFMLIIDGDSMSPKFSNGDYVLIRQQPAVDIGQIGIFNVEGKGYIKKYEGDHLASLNPKYKDISLKDKDFRCFGLVLGVATLA